jgi:hypothetical protein
VRIGAAKDVDTLLRELNEEKNEIVELLVIKGMRSKDGTFYFSFEQTRTVSCFRLAGVLLWVANKIMH